MTIEEISKDFLRRPFDELAMIEAGRMLSVCNYKINKASKQTLSSEKVDTAGLTVEQLQTKLTDLVAAKHFAL
jgi:hypothetical protein